MAAPNYPTGEPEPYHLFGIAHYTGGEFDLRATLAKVASLCTVVPEATLEVFIEEIVVVVGTAKIDGYNSEKGFFFKTCRRLKCHVSAGEREGMGFFLAPLALLQIELLDKAGKLPSDDMWTDAVAVALEFEVAWDQVQYAETESLWREILERAKHEGPLVQKGTFGLLVRFAWHLQKHQGDKPIFLPINKDFADLFGVTERQLSTYVNACHTRGYLTPKSKCLPKQRARTWFFNFDHEHFRTRLTVT